jgi:hypothetical protein
MDPQHWLEQTKTPPYLIVESEVQLSTLTTVNADNCLPKNSTMEQPIGEGRVQYEEGEGKGWEVT